MCSCPGATELMTIFLLCRVHCDSQWNYHQLQRSAEVLGEEMFVFFRLLETSFFHPIYKQKLLVLSPQESKGYEFESETDTETIAKLVKYMYDNRENDEISFATLVERVTQQLVRTCQCMAMLTDYLFLKKSPLTCLFFPLPGGSICTGLQECPLSWRSSWNKVWSMMLSWC